MNKAQKRMWLSLTISIATLLAATAVTVFIRANQINLLDPQTLIKNALPFRLLGLACTIPLILMVLLSWRFPTRDFDERDKHIDRQSVVSGLVGAFVFLGGAVWLLCIISRVGLIKSLLLPFLVYLAYFVSVLVSSTAALIQYGWTGKGEK